MKGRSEDSPLFARPDLPNALVADLRRLNPWWEGTSMRRLPATRRHMVRWIHRRLASGLAPIVVVKGPRQIGKTTAQLHVIQDLLQQGVSPRRIMRVQFEDHDDLTRLGRPVLRIADWYEHHVLQATLNDAAAQGEPAYLFLDEVQNLKDWDTQLKALVDASTVKVIVTGSSALRLEMGRDSLSGRISDIEAGVLSLTEVGLFHNLDVGEPLLPDNGLEPLLSVDWWQAIGRVEQERERAVQSAFRWFSDRGGYPLCHEKAEIPWPQVADQLNENVIRRVIQHDLRVGDRGRKRDAALLEEVFRLCCRYVGQSPGPQALVREVQRTLDANVGTNRIRQYLRFLDNTLLIRVIRPLEIRLKRRQGHAKLCLADHALRASWLQEVVPVDPDQLADHPHLSDLAGRIAESICGALLASISGLDLSHLPERHDQPEIDFVLTIGTKRIPLEVKYRRRIDWHADTEGIRTFLEKPANNAPFGVLVCQKLHEGSPHPQIVAVPLSSLMLIR